MTQLDLTLPDAPRAKVWDRAAINELLLRNDRAVERALLVLLARQTDDEVTSQETRHRNSRGFSGVDAEFLTSLALRVKRGRGLTPNQLAAVRKPNRQGICKLAKYWRQLAEEAAARA